MRNKHNYYRAEQCNLADFQEMINQKLIPDSVPHASKITNNIPIYDIPELQNILQNYEQKYELMAEWAWVLRAGSGAIVLSKAYHNTSVIDEATKIYEKIISDEKLKNVGGADHFAAAGANDRIWNSLQKLCESSPGVF